MARRRVPWEGAAIGTQFHSSRGKYRPIASRLSDESFQILIFKFGGKTRALAHEIKDDWSRETMLNVAEGYERMARKAEEKSAGAPPLNGQMH